MRCRLFYLILALFLSVSILSGCGPGETTDLIEGTEITLYFKEDYAGGSMTCNNYGGGPDSGQYEATDDGTLKVPQLAWTVQLCSEPEGVMEQEKAYIEALQDAATYRVVDTRLEIHDAAGETILVFAKRTEKE